MRSHSLVPSSRGGDVAVASPGRAPGHPRCHRHFRRRQQHGRDDRPRSSAKQGRALTFCRERCSQRFISPLPPRPPPRLLFFLWHCAKNVWLRLCCFLTGGRDRSSAWLPTEGAPFRGTAESFMGFPKSFRRSLNTHAHVVGFPNHPSPPRRTSRRPRMCFPLGRYSPKWSTGF